MATPLSAAQSYSACSLYLLPFGPWLILYCAADRCQGPGWRSPGRNSTKGACWTAAGHLRACVLLHAVGVRPPDDGGHAELLGKLPVVLSQQLHDVVSLHTAAEARSDTIPPRRLLAASDILLLVALASVQGPVHGPPIRVQAVLVVTDGIRVPAGTAESHPAAQAWVLRTRTFRAGRRT